MVFLKKIFYSWFMFWVAFAVIGVWSLVSVRNAIRFGIDLVGGTYITLEVQTEKAVESELFSQSQTISEKLEKAGFPKVVSLELQNNEILLTFDSAQSAQRAASFFKATPAGLMRDPRHAFTDLKVIKVEGSVVYVGFSKNAIEAIGTDAVERIKEVLSNRLNPLNVGEISIVTHGDRNLIVELPDVKDPVQAKSMIGTSATLEFKLVQKMGSSIEDILYELDGELGSDQEIVPSSELDHEGKPRYYYLVSKYATISGKDLKHASAGLHHAKPVAVVNFEFTHEGGEHFHALTSKNIGRPLAIILDGKVISAPTINVALRTSGLIESSEFTTESARELATLLKSGSFVAPVRFDEERIIGPTLGEESVRQGVMSCLIGLGLLLIFSLFYYKVAGLFAFFALIYNLFLILIGLALLGSTLTLPGIAGMVLTIGMAIDASILIYEQIKEELISGTSFRVAVDKGFAGAMTVILDANITTFIVGVVLYKFGTGPIQGFAVTMMLGIIATLITGLFFLRSLFNFVFDVFNVQKIKI